MPQEQAPFATLDSLGIAESPHAHGSEFIIAKMRERGPHCRIAGTAINLAVLKNELI